MNRHDCTHPAATPTADGAVLVAHAPRKPRFPTHPCPAGVEAWCSNCGWAKVKGVWTPPQAGKSGKLSHASRGRHLFGYLLPSKEQYVAAGYPEDTYEDFMAIEQTPVDR